MGNRRFGPCPPGNIFGGQSISLIGTWITRIATSWLVYRLTGSELLLGVVGFCSQIPMLILSPFAGVLVDRWDNTPFASASDLRLERFQEVRRESNAEAKF